MHKTGGRFNGKNNGNTHVALFNMAKRSLNVGGRRGTALNEEKENINTK